METLLTVIIEFSKLESSNYTDYETLFFKISKNLSISEFYEAMGVFLLKYYKNIDLIKTHMSKTELYKKELLVTYINITIPHLLNKSSYTFIDNLCAMDLLKNVIEYNKIANDEIVFNGFLLSAYYLLYQITLSLSDFSLIWKKLLFITLKKSVELTNHSIINKNSNYLKSILIVVINNLFGSNIKEVNSSKEYNIILKELSKMNI